MEEETPELADKLEAYQLKAKDALANAFSGDAVSLGVTFEKPTMAEVRYMELKAKYMDKMGCSPFDVSAMIARTSQAYHLYVSPVFANKVDPQMCLFDSRTSATPMLTA